MNNNPAAPRDQPTTTAKVIMVTSSGELEIQLWANQTPLACQNFIQLAFDGYYDNTIFHRLIPGFMVQGGDPTGTGTGGESIYGGQFKDQFHQRLKFGRRGMLAMANSGKDTNGSQFFITFGECTHLNKKHTIFGKVVGDSVYNLMAMQSLETDKEDRPLFPPSIRKIKVLLNPFDNVFPRKIKSGENQAQSEKITQEEEKKIRKTEIKKLKNKNKLTFDQQDEDVDLTQYKIKSSHDTLNDQKLSKKVAVSQQQLQRKRRQKQAEEEKKKQIAKRLNQATKTNEDGQENINQMLKREMLKKMNNADGNDQQEVQDQVLKYQKRVNPETGKVQLIWGNQQDKQQENKEKQGFDVEKLRELQQKQYQALIADELNFKKLKQGTAKEKRKQLVAEQITLLSNLQRRKYQFLKKNQVQKKQGEVLTKLNKFTQRLNADSPSDWMCHALKFHIDSQNAFSLDKKNQERRGRKQMQDDDDGGLKVDYGNYELEEEGMNLDQLDQLTKK